MEENAEMYEIKSVNEDGKEVVVYATPANRRMTAKFMAEEYGNVEERGIAMSDLPDGVGPEN